MKINQFRIVMKFEYMNYMRNKVYLGITIFIVILLALGLSAPNIISTAREFGISPADPDRDDPASTVYIIDHTADMNLEPHLRDKLPGERWRKGEIADTELYRQKIDDREAKAMIIVESQQSMRFVTRRFGTDQLAGNIERVLSEYFQMQMLSESGLTEADISRLLTPPQMERIELVEEAGKSMEQTYFYTYLLVFLLYMTVMMYGQLVASSVASEKSNRAMEMLITSARPMDLMFGKVIGSGLAGLTQISVFLITAAGFYYINESSWSDIPFIQSIFEMPAHIIFFTIFFYLSGYFMFSFLYGALGSLASRIEDINTSIMPMMLILMAAMLVSVFGMLNPDARFLTIFSFIPFFSPMAMFVRIAMTDVTVLEIIVSVSIMLMTIIVTGWLSSKIYRAGVLMYGKPPRIKELVKILRQEKA